jgi:hypothetical protein
MKKDNLLWLYYDGGGSATGNKGRIGVATAPVVPVELISFTATSNGSEVFLNWSTATEINNSGFSIERKSGTSEYSEIGFVPVLEQQQNPNLIAIQIQKSQQGNIHTA